MSSFYYKKTKGEERCKFPTALYLFVVQTSITDLNKMLAPSQNDRRWAQKGWIDMNPHFGDNGVLLTIAGFIS